MYKKGRFWIFAGMTLLSWQLVGTTAQAANTDQDNTTNSPTTATTTTPKTADTKQVILDTADKTTTDSSTTNTTVVTDDSNADTAQKPSSTTPSNSESTKQTTVPDMDKTNSNVSKPDSNQVEEPVKTTSDSTTPASNQNRSNPTDMTEQKTTNAANQSTTVSNPATPKRMQLSRNSLMRMASVEDGGWSVTDDGAGNVVLHFAGGTTLSTAGRAYDQPWRADYSSTITEIDFDGPVTAGKDLSQIFSFLSNLKTINNANLLDTSNTTDMNQMFENDSKLTAINGIDSWNTSKVTNLSNMFFSNWKLTSLNVNSWDTSKVTNMAGTFEQTALTSLDLSNWKTSNVTNLSGMFVNDQALTSLNLIGPGWDTTNVTDMSGLFQTTHITNLLDNIRDWNTSNVTDMSRMFWGANLATWDISNWDTSKVTNMRAMLGSNAFTSLDLNDWNTSNVTNMTDLFSSCTKLTKITINKWDIKNVTHITDLFRNDFVLQILNLNDWNTSSITDFSYAFKDCQQLTSLTINNWNTSNVTNADGIFYNLFHLNELNLDHWNTTNFKDTNYLFENSTIPTITFGPQVTLPSNCQLSAMSGITKGYTGNWVNTANPKDILTDSELIAAYATPRNTTLTYTWQYMPTIKLKNSTLKLGATEAWQPSDNFLTATDDHNNSVDLTNPMITNDGATAIDPMTLGYSTVTFSYNYLSADGKIASVEFQTKVLVYGLILKNKIINIPVAANWDPRDNIAQGLENTNWSAPASSYSIIVRIPTASRNLDQPGTYTITYILDDFTTTATVNVTSKAQLVGQSAAIKWHGSWTAADGLISAIDENGVPITDFNKIKVTGTVNVNTLGRYTVTYDYTDPVGNTVSSGPITVAVYGIVLNYKNIDKITTDSWDPESNINTAVNLSGDKLPRNDLTITRADGGNVDDLSKIGTYTINYALGTDYLTSMTVHVYSNAKITSRDVRFKVGTPWDMRGVLIALDEHNRFINDNNKFTSSNTVDTTTPGVYTATYSYTDAAGNIATSAPAQVIVYGLRLDQDSFTKSTTASWNPADHIIAAVDETGKTIPAQDIVVTIPADSQNLTLPGTYDLTYSLGNTDTVTAKMTVTNQAQLAGQTTAIKLGNTWQPETGIKAAIDENGQTLNDFSRVTETDNVNSNQLGVYHVTYTYIDAAGNQTTAPTVQVIVYGIILKQTDLTKSTTGKLDLADNVRQALDRAGILRSGSDVTVTAPADNPQLGRLGIAPIAYTLDDYTAPATVTITSAAKLVGQATSIKLGTSWDPTSGIKTALDENGVPITDLHQLKVTGNLDTSNPGIYSVVYHYVDAAGNDTSAAPVNVVVYGISLAETSKTLTPTDDWQPLSNVTRAVTPTGDTASTADIQVTLTDSNGQPVTDLAQPGKYLVTYHLADATVTMPVTVISLAAINAHNVTLTVGDSWNAAMGLTNATAFDGQPLSLAQLTLTGSVDANTIGTYPVTYSYTDGENQVTTKTVLVTVTAKPATVNNQPRPNPASQRPAEEVAHLAVQPTTRLKSDPIQSPAKIVATRADSVVSLTHSGQATPFPTDQATKKAPVTKTLPQTNEAHTTANRFLGLVLFACTGLLFGLGRYYKRQRH